jgi:hypothetical protein
MKNYCRGSSVQKCLGNTTLEAPEIILPADPYLWNVWIDLYIISAGVSVDLCECDSQV